MIIRGTARVRCPGCGTQSDQELVQSINTRVNPTDKQRLLAGELNVLACACGRRTQLASNILFHDPDAEYFCQVAPGGETAMADAAIAFAASGVTGRQRLVPSQNALVEKVKILDAALEDWAIEMTKVLLLASTGELDRVLLFESVAGSVIHWLIFRAEDRAPEHVTSPLAAYEKIAARARSRPASSELRIDRAWAVEAVKAMIADAN